MRRIGSIILAGAALLLAGCETAPRQPVMRPIPPPPSTPPPGAAVIVYAPATNAVNATASNVVTAPHPQGNYEVTSNYVAGATTATTNAATALQTTPGQQAIPQYEIVPPRPGPNYVWRDGFWSWQGNWVWIPGQWMYQPPSYFMQEPGFSYHYHFGSPWSHRYRRHHHFHGHRHRWH